MRGKIKTEWWDEEREMRILTGDADVGFSALGGPCRAPGHTLTPEVLRAEQLLHLLPSDLYAGLSHDKAWEDRQKGLKWEGGSERAKMGKSDMKRRRKKGKRVRERKWNGSISTYQPTIWRTSENENLKQAKIHLISWRLHLYIVFSHLDEIDANVSGRSRQTNQFTSVISHALTLGICVMSVCVCVSLAPSLEPKCWAVWVWALWGRILSVMANTILFANSSDYRSSGCQDPNKQTLPKTNASTHTCPSRADYASPPACVHIYVCLWVCMRAYELSACIYVWILCWQSIHWGYRCFPCLILPYFVNSSSYFDWMRYLCRQWRYH